MLVSSGLLLPSLSTDSRRLERTEETLVLLIYAVVLSLSRLIVPRYTWIDHPIVGVL